MAAAFSRAGQTYVIPLFLGRMLPDIPAAGFQSEEEPYGTPLRKHADYLSVVGQAVMPRFFRRYRCAGKSRPYCRQNRVKSFARVHSRGLFRTAVRSARRFPADGRRSAGALARQRLMMVSSFRGISGHESRKGEGSADLIKFIVATSFRPANGRAQATIS